MNFSNFLCPEETTKFKNLNYDISKRLSDITKH